MMTILRCFSLLPNRDRRTRRRIRGKEHSVMDPPPAQYVTTTDGKTIAYGISGSGPAFVIGPIPFSHVQLVWGVHSFSGFIHELAQRFRVIHIDPRGLGMSQRGVGQDHRLEDGLIDI